MTAASDLGARASIRDRRRHFRMSRYKPRQNSTESNQLFRLIRIWHVRRDYSLPIQTYNKLGRRVLHTATRTHAMPNHCYKIRLRWREQSPRLSPIIIAFYPPQLHRYLYRPQRNSRQCNHSSSTRMTIPLLTMAK